MTSKELYVKLSHINENRYYAQLLSTGLDVNLSGMFSTFIKDAARCNGYNSDVYYDMKTIEESVHNYNPEEEFTPIWVGFRKLGVDGTEFVLCKVDLDNIYSSLKKNYFALYSVDIRNENDSYYVVLREYAV